MTLFPEIDAARVAERAAAAAHDQRLREHEADFTPRTVADPLVDAVMPTVIERWQAARARGERGSVLRVCGLCSGPGVWESSVLRWCYAHGIEVEITAVEIRPEELEHIRRHAHVVMIADWHEALGMVWDGRAWVWGDDPPRFDLVISNPAFTQARAPYQPAWPPPRFDANGKKIKATPAETASRKRLRAEAVDAGLRPELAEYDPDQAMPVLALQVSEVVALYGTQQCWTKTASGWLVREACSFDEVFDVPGAVGHRGRGIGQDQIPYSLFVWLRGPRPERAALSAIAPPASGDRNWTIRPGCESDDWLLDHGVPVFAERDGTRVLLTPDDRERNRPGAAALRLTGDQT